MIQITVTINVHDEDENDFQSVTDNFESNLMDLIGSTPFDAEIVSVEGEVVEDEERE